MNNTEKKDFYYWYEATTSFIGRIVIISAIAGVFGILIIMPIFNAILGSYSEEVSSRLNELEIISKEKPLSIDQQIEFHRLMEMKLTKHKKDSDILTIKK